MDDKTFPPFIINSKLHRPQIHGAYIHRQQLINQLDQRSTRPLILISAPAGYGKTTLASSWLETTGTPYAWVALDESDNDLRLFLGYILTAVQTIFPDFGRQTLAMVNASTLAPVAALVGSLINEIDRIEQSFILALDDFHLIKDESVLELLTELLRHPPQSMHLMLIGRWDPVLPISTARAKRLIAEIRTQDLRFDEMEIERFLAKMLGFKVDTTTAAALAKKTEGWVTGLVLAAFSMRNQGGLDPALLEPHVTAQSVMEYLFTEVFSRQPTEISRYLMNTAILDRFCGPLCEAVCAPGGDSPTFKIDGWGFIAWLKKQNLFLIPLDVEKRWFRFHHLFQRLLLNQLRRHFSQGDINNLHARASQWFAENGLIDEAIKHALAGGNSKTAAQLVVKHGFDLLNNMEWLHLQRWLSMLPKDIIRQDSGLLILLAWTYLVFSRNAEMMSCLDKAKALISDQPNPPAATEHLLGHLDAMQALQSYYSAEPERALIHAQRAKKDIHRKHRYPRILVSVIRPLMHQMIGDSQKAQSEIEEMMRDETLRGGKSEGFLLVSPSFFYWIEADLTTMLLTADSSQKINGVLQNPWNLGHSLYFSGIVNYHRNEFHNAEEKLFPVVKNPYLHHALNFAHSAFALALINQALGRAAAANDVAESVVVYAHDTKNADVLNLSRAFQAELALRQGRLAEASLWAEHFDAKPFTVMYRFYVPQLTLVRVLLAQNTADSREQAADLLRQLYEFVTSTHNRRFQIDVLALLALLYDSRGEGTAALEKLTHALQLAEAGGFIRPFVDLGPALADLLKRLHKQRIAVDYTEKILAAYEQEAVFSSAICNSLRW